VTDGVEFNKCQKGENVVKIMRKCCLNENVKLREREREREREKERKKKRKKEKKREDSFNQWDEYNKEK
jgi:hypothetical protein